MIKRVRPPKSWWRSIGLKARNLYRRETFDKGQNVYGDDWAGGKYSPEYAAYKSRGGRNDRQSAAHKDQVTPIYTADTFRDLKRTKIRAKGGGVEFGFSSRGDVVRKLAKRGKKYTLTSEEKPLPDAVVKYVTNEYNKYIKKNSKGRTRHHRKK